MNIECQYVGTQLSQYNGKYACLFNMVKNGNFVSAGVESGSVFDTEEGAEEAGLRAVLAVAQSGKFPNMCKKW